MAPFPYQAYAERQVQTSSPAEIMILLYRGAVRFAAKARLQIQNRELENAHNSLMRAQQVVLELRVGILPGQHEVTTNLHALHSYIYEVLIDANTRKDVALIDEALKHLRELLQTWEQIALPARAGAASGSVVTFDRHC